MDSVSLISFVRTDIKPIHIEDITIEIADHFKVPRFYIPQFCKLISNSKRWTHKNWETQFEAWKTRFSSINPSETKNIISLVKRGFESCVDDNEIHDLRGSMLEALIMGAYGGGTEVNNKDEYGWGARVDLNFEGKVTSIRYIAPNVEGAQPIRRSTVDFGYWNKKHGKFYECKVQPKALTSLEINYMLTLREKLQEHKISNEIFFAFAASKDTVDIELKKFNLENFYKPIGYEDIVEMISA